MARNDLLRVELCDLGGVREPSIGIDKLASLTRALQAYLSISFEAARGWPQQLVPSLGIRLEIAEVWPGSININFRPIIIIRGDGATANLGSVEHDATRGELEKYADLLMKTVRLAVGCLVAAYPQMLTEPNPRPQDIEIIANDLARETAERANFVAAMDNMTLEMDRLDAGDVIIYAPGCPSIRLKANSSSNSSLFCSAGRPEPQETIHDGIEVEISADITGSRMEALWNGVPTKLYIAKLGPEFGGITTILVWKVNKDVPVGAQATRVELRGKFTRGPNVKAMEPIAAAFRAATLFFEVSALKSF